LIYGQPLAKDFSIYVIEIGSPKVIKYYSIVFIFKLLQQHRRSIP
jgi:hypothetical protein